MTPAWVRHHFLHQRWLQANGAEPPLLFREDEALPMGGMCLHCGAEVAQPWSFCSVGCACDADPNDEIGVELSESSRPFKQPRIPKWARRTPCAEEL